MADLKQKWRVIQIKMAEEIITKSLVEDSPLRGLWSEYAQDCNCDIYHPTNNELNKENQKINYNPNKFMNNK